MQDTHTQITPPARAGRSPGQIITVVAVALLTLVFSVGCKRQGGDRTGNGAQQGAEIEAANPEAAGTETGSPDDSQQGGDQTGNGVQQGTANEMADPEAAAAGAGSPDASPQGGDRTGNGFQLQPVQLRMPENATQRINSGLARPQLGAAPAGARPRLNVPQLQPPPPH